MNQPTQTYRQFDIQGASPVGLIILLYDAALKSLHRALEALEAGDIERRTKALNHVVEVVGELQRSLNHEQGGQLTGLLDRFYSIVRGKIMEANIKASREILEELVEQFRGLREGWKQVEQETAVPNSAATSPAQAGRARAPGAAAEDSVWSQGWSF